MIAVTRGLRTQVSAWCCSTVVRTHCSYDASSCWRPCFLCGSHKDLEQRAIWSHVGIIFVHVQAPAQDATFYQKLSRQPPPHMTNCFHPVPRITSFRLTSLRVLASLQSFWHYAT